jgi:hypothetical protein
MTNEELLREISNLSIDARHHIEHYLALLQKKKENAATKNSKKSFRDEAVFGMWKDREDMKDGAEWVRNLRETHWKR